MDNDRVRLVDWSDRLDRSLALETLRSQRTRATILAFILSFLLVAFLVLALVPGTMTEALAVKFRRIVLPIAFLIGGIAVYELGVRWWLSRLMRAERPTPAYFGYVNAVIETSLPTIVMIVGAGAIGPIQVMHSATPFVYFMFILLATLQLNARLCVFTGALCGLGFVVVALRSLAIAPVPSDFGLLAAPHQFIVKGILLVMAGFVAGFVAKQIRRQFQESLRTLAERDRAISIFGQHVSPEVADKLLSQPAGFSGEVRNVCVMFLDIRDFSNFAADNSPENVMTYLNDLFGSMIDIVNSNRGIVNKFLGDGFMAVFGAPADDAKQCEHALDAAMAIVAEVERKNSEKIIPLTRIGIGLHVGEAVTGNVGSAQRKEYTIIGDVVNLASRIEQATKMFDAQLLVSESVKQALGRTDLAVEDLGPVELKGQPKPVRIFKFV